MGYARLSRVLARPSRARLSSVASFAAVAAATALSNRIRASANTCAAGYMCDNHICVALLEDGAHCSIDECLGRCDYATLRCVSAEPYCDEAP